MHLCQQVWNAAYPVSVKYKHDMKAYDWKYTQYSEFNASDTLIMVSGVYKGDQRTTAGEIAVFSVVGECDKIIQSSTAIRAITIFDLFGPSPPHR